MKRRKQRKALFPMRSQKSMLRQLELEASREKCRNQIVFGEKRISELKGIADRQTVTALEGSHSIRQALNATLADIEERTREVAAYRKREEDLTAQIHVLEHPSAKDRRERAKHQTELAALEIDLSAKDAVLDSMLEKLRKALAARKALVAEIAGRADLIDFSGPTDWDGGTLAALESSLPVDVFARSREWIEQFLGTEPDKEFCTVGHAGGILPETLADHGVYRPGETVLLSKNRAKLLPCEPAEPALPGPVEMEVQAGNVLTPVEHKPAEAEAFPVSGFRMDSSPL